MCGKQAFRITFIKVSGNFTQQQCTIVASTKLVVPTEISYVQNMTWYQHFSTLCMQRDVKEDGAKITSELVWPL